MMRCRGEQYDAAHNDAVPNDAARNDGVQRGDHHVRLGFTIVELLVVITIGSIISGMVAVALNGANATAKAERTRGQVERFSLLTLQLYEQAANRQIGADVGVRIPSTAPPSIYRNNQNNELVANGRQLAILNWKRDYLRLAMPDSIEDLRDEPVEIRYQGFRRGVGGGGATTYLGTTFFLDQPVVAGAATIRGQARRRIIDRALQLVDRVTPGVTEATLFGAAGNDNGLWSKTNQSAECLYLIFATSIVNNRPALDSIQAREIVDSDEDGIPEIVDAYENPMGFIRWPAGYYLHRDYVTAADIAASRTTQDTLPNQIGEDPLDVLRVDPRLQDDGSAGSQLDDTFIMVPLIVSAGSDGLFDLLGLDTPTTYRYASNLMSGMQFYASNRFTHTSPVPPNNRFIDPYTHDANTTIASYQRYGTPRDDSGDGDDNASDNVYSTLVFE